MITAIQTTEHLQDQSVLISKKDKNEKIYNQDKRPFTSHNNDHGMP